MTKHLINYCPIDWYEDELKRKGMTLAGLVQQLGVDGIEQFVYRDPETFPDYKELTFGAHLNYWPYWMDFWLRKAVIRRNICAAISQKPEYLVWHVAEADTETIFTFDFHYDDREVLAASADIFNAVADEIPANVTVLFENLWWPGLRLTDARKVKFFFERIERKNVGIMLDTGHLMNTNPRLRTEAEAADFVCRTVDKLGPYAELIKGVHLSCSLSGKYLRSFERKVPADLNAEAIWRHIAAIDRHKPFTTTAAKQILQCVQPQYVNHELAYETIEEMIPLMQQQLSVAR